VALVPLAVLPSIGAAQPIAAAQPVAQAHRPQLGQAPPEMARNAKGWPGHNYDLANTRSTTRTRIDSRNVADLTVKWRLPLTADPTFVGVYSSTPIVLDGTVYLIDLNSKVIAVDEHTGRVRWEHAYNDPSVGPNGLAYGWGMLFGSTFHGVFALDPRTGEEIWHRDLVGHGLAGIDVAPVLYDHTVLIGSVPSTFKQYEPSAMGMVWAFDARTGEKKWEFNTVKDGDLWGRPDLNSGGGIWYPPAVDSTGRVFLAVANPAPFPGTTEFPNGASRPGPNLYTNSVVALDGKTGRLLWYQQVLPHDVRDYDLQISPIITHTRIDGVRTEIVVVAGKMGKVFAFRADDGAPLWTLPVGKHQNDEGPLPMDPVTVLPGIFGGVETPMALADNRLFVPWVDVGSELGADDPYVFPDLASGRGGILAADVTTGRALWKRELPQMNFGAATVANDVVFTSTYNGTTYALDARTGRTLWTDTARAGINSFPAIAGDTLFVVAGATAFHEKPVYELIAYSPR
jgi:alcohol dehydrogenase (cytochrome c)